MNHIKIGKLDALELFRYMNQGNHKDRLRKIQVYCKRVEGGRGQTRKAFAYTTDHLIATYSEQR